jgi:hypothetical protein
MLRILSILILLQPIGFFGEDDVPVCAKHVESPQYPQLARLAQISGDVVVKVSISTEGTVAGADGISGPSLLRDYAAQNLKKWVFDRGPERVLEIQFNFKLQNPPTKYAPPPVVTFDLPDHVEILSSYSTPGG